MTFKLMHCLRYVNSQQHVVPVKDGSLLMQVGGLNVIQFFRHDLSMIWEEYCKVLDRMCNNPLKGSGFKQKHLLQFSELVVTCVLTGMFGSWQAGWFCRGGNSHVAVDRMSSGLRTIWLSLSSSLVQAYSHGDRIFSNTQASPKVQMFSRTPLVSYALCLIGQNKSANPRLQRQTPFHKPKELEYRKRDLDHFKQP